MSEPLRDSVSSPDDDCDGHDDPAAQQRRGPNHRKRGPPTNSDDAQSEQHDAGRVARLRDDGNGNGHQMAHRPPLARRPDAHGAGPARAALSNAPAMLIELVQATLSSRCTQYLALGCDLHIRGYANTD